MPKRASAPRSASAGSLNPQRSLWFFECRVSQTRPGTRPQRSEVSPDGWGAVLASFLVRSATRARAQRETQHSACHFKSRVKAHRAAAGAVAAAACASSVFRAARPRRRRRRWPKRR